MDQSAGECVQLDTVESGAAEASCGLMVGVQNDVDLPSGLTWGSSRPNSPMVCDGAEVTWPARGEAIDEVAWLS